MEYLGNPIRACTCQQRAIRATWILFILFFFFFKVWIFGQLYLITQRYHIIQLLKPNLNYHEAYSKMTFIFFCIDLLSSLLLTFLIGLQIFKISEFRFKNFKVQTRIQYFVYFVQFESKFITNQVCMILEFFYSY